LIVPKLEAFFAALFVIICLCYSVIHRVMGEPSNSTERMFSPFRPAFLFQRPGNRVCALDSSTLEDSHHHSSRSRASQTSTGSPPRRRSASTPPPKAASAIRIPCERLLGLSSRPASVGMWNFDCCTALSFENPEVRVPFIMMWMPYYYWNAIFAWQKNITDLMNYTRVKPREPKAAIADDQTSSPIVAPARDLVVNVSGIAAEAKERRTEQTPAKLTKPMSRRKPSSSKKSKQSQKNGSAKMAKSRGRRALGARA
jgi:hypothetical protein